jgi:N-acetyl-alpha-D-glucosaminyl L-malate synthase BshA
MITSEFPPKWGGVGNYSFFHANIMAQTGHEVHIYTRDQAKKFTDHHKNLKIHYVPWMKIPVFFTTSFGKHAVEAFLSKESEFDILQVQSNMALLKSKHYDMIKIPIVSTLHGTWIGERSTVYYRNISTNLESINDLAIKWFSPFLDKYEDYAIQRSNAVVIGAKSECRDVSQRGVKNQFDRIERIHHGVDTETFGPENVDPNYKSKYNIPEDHQVILHVGRLAARKGVKEVLMSFRKVLDRYKKVKLLIVGIGPLMNKLLKLTRKLDLEKDVIFIGTVTFGDLVKFYASCDFFVMHSYWEGFGMTPQEALASGLPVVSSRAGGIPEFVKNGETGYLVKVGDVDGMAKYMVKILKDPELRNEMSKNARKLMVDEYDWGDMVDKYLKLYELVLEDPKNQKGLPKIGKKCF